MKANSGQLADFRWGLERETHRILGDGTISPAEHPESLKAPSFTKDFAESQLEIVTKPHPSAEAAMKELAASTLTAHRELGTERFWPFSMPPVLSNPDSVVTARKGSDDTGRNAERYRQGLSNRYGIARQMICGVHVNVSFGPELLGLVRKIAPLSPEEAKERTESNGYYLRLVRNLFEDMPLFVLAFGASPVLANIPGNRSEGPAFSYRNSPLGYARKEYRPFLELDSLDAHLEGIRRGLRTESETFRQLGLVKDGKTIQLNDRIFQKEKEFYAPIRFRRTAGAGESPLDALEKRGIEYLELRFFDIDPFTPFGVSRDALNLIHLFILDGITRESASRTNGELAEILDHADRAALGNPLVNSPAEYVPDIGARIDSLRTFAAAIGPEYERTLESYALQLGSKGKSPAARLLDDFRSSGFGWNEYGALVAERNRKGVLDAK